MDMETAFLTFGRRTGLCSGLMPCLRQNEMAKDKVKSERSCEQLSPLLQIAVRPLASRIELLN